MEYLVMECGLSYAVVMDGAGRFWKIPNLGYTVGQSLKDVVLSLLEGCGAQPAEQASSKNEAVGTVLLSVNPEIEVDYDKNGLVLEIEGLNEDGKTVVKDVKNYQGKDCRPVVSELVRDIYDGGYFEGTVDGHAKNIVLKLEEGSVYVSDEFLQDVADGVRETVQECGVGAETMTVSEGDLDDAGHIGQNKAKELVLTQLGLESASFRDHEYELDDGVCYRHYSIRNSFSEPVKNVNCSACNGNLDHRNHLCINYAAWPRCYCY